MPQTQVVQRVQASEYDKERLGGPLGRGCGPTTGYSLRFRPNSAVRRLPLGVRQVTLRPNRPEPHACQNSVFPLKLADSVSPEAPWDDRRNRLVVQGRQGPPGNGGARLVPVRWVFIHDVQGTHRDEYFYTTDISLGLRQITSWFTARWPIETTFQEVRAHLGFETPRQYVAKSVLHTAPCLLGLFSIICLIFAQHARFHRIEVRSTEWYIKADPTFSDAIAARLPRGLSVGQATGRMLSFFRNSRREARSPCCRFFSPTVWFLSRIGILNLRWYRGTSNLSR